MNTYIENHIFAFIQLFLNSCINKIKVHTGVNKLSFCMSLKITAKQVAIQNLQRRQYLSIDPASLRDETVFLFFWIIC